MISYPVISSSQDRALSSVAQYSNISDPQTPLMLRKTLVCRGLMVAGELGAATRSRNLTPPAPLFVRGQGWTSHWALGGRRTVGHQPTLKHNYGQSNQG